jgi:hypothetical protein
MAKFIFYVYLPITYIPLAITDFYMHSYISTIISVLNYIKIKGRKLHLIVTAC